MTTSVPQVYLGANGYIAPSESDILVGVQADINSDFGGNLAFSNGSPELQMANTMTAIIGNANALLLALFNGVDPAYASGRMQDAIGRIYFMTRDSAESTVLQVACVGAYSVSIPVGALVQNPVTGDIFSCTQAGTIPPSGSITLPFACTVTGPIAVPSSLTIYQLLSGWDTATVSSGVVGVVVENRSEYENRRQGIVESNSLNSVQAVRGAVLGITNVLSVYSVDNGTSSPIAYNAAATTTGSISGTALTVTSGSGIVDGQTISGTGVAVGTTVVSGSGTSWVITPSQTVISTALSFGGVQVLPNSIYVCVAGGIATAIAQAILSKKPPGCNYTGNTSATAYDSSPPYVAPGIPYTVTWQSAVNTLVYFNVTVANSITVPSGALTLIQQAIANAFSGADGGSSAQIGVNLLASRFYSGIASLGVWAQILSIQMGSSAATPAASITAGGISGTTLTSTTQTGTLAPGQVLTGTGVAAGTTILSQISGSTGSTGTYEVSIGQTVSGVTISAMAVASTSLQMTIAQMPISNPAYIALTLQ